MSKGLQKTPGQRLNEAIRDLNTSLEDAKVANLHKQKIENLINIILLINQEQDVRISDLESSNWDLQMKNRDLKAVVTELEKKHMATEREQELLSLLNDSKKFFNKVKNQCLVAAYGENINDWSRRVAEVSSNYDSKIPSKAIGFKKIA